MNAPRKSPDPRIPLDPEFTHDHLPPDDDVAALRRLLRASTEALPAPSEARLLALRRAALERAAIERPTFSQLLAERWAAFLDTLGGGSAFGRSLQLAAAAACGAFLAVGVIRLQLPAAQPGTASGAVAVANNTAVSTGHYAAVDGIPPRTTARPPSDTNSAVLAPSLQKSPSTVLGHPSGTPVVSQVLDPAPSADKAVHASPATTPSGVIGKSSKSPTDVAGVGSGSGAAGAGTPSLDPGSVLHMEGLDNLKSGNGVFSVKAESSKPLADAGDSLEFSALEKIRSYKQMLQLTGEARALSEFQKLEPVLMDVMQRNESSNGAGTNYQKVLRLLRDADAARGEARWATAISAYSQVAQAFPSSPVGFFAKLDMADISFENLNDFGSALEVYQECLQAERDYLTPDKRTLILNRVKLLSRTAHNNYESLHWYREAKRSAPGLAAVRYLDLLEKYPEGPLSGTAAQALADLASGDPQGQSVDVQRVLPVLQQLLQKSPNHPEGAQIQFAIADLWHHRLFDARQAAVEYDRVLQFNPNPELATVVRARLQELMQLRAATPAP